MAFKKIYVSRAKVEANQNNGTSESVFTVYIGDAEHHTNSIIILGPSEIRYDPNAQEGSRVWIETFSRLILKDGKQLIGL